MGKYSFKYVLRRYDKLPTLPFLLVGYKESVTSIPFKMNGIMACTAFLEHITTVNRYTKLGWIDETEAMKEEFDRLERQKEAVPNKKIKKDKKDDKMEFNSPAKSARRRVKSEK